MAIIAEILQDVEQFMAGGRKEFTHDSHISDEDLAALADHRVSLKERKAIIAHLSHCRRCRKIVSEVMLSRSAVKDPDQA